MKRGAIKAFREYLNREFPFRSETVHRHLAYHQVSRPYGDYLYHQDREKFDYEIIRAMNGEFDGFDPEPWREGARA